MSKKNKELRVLARTETGKKASKRDREQGLIPAEVYGHSAKNQSLLVNAVEWATLLREDSDINLLDLAGDKIKKTVLIKDVQYSIINRDPIHIDFQEVKMDEELTTSVAIHALPGDPIGLSHGGLLEQVMHEVQVVCKPADLPESIQVDISGIEVGQSLVIKELPVIDGVKYDHDEDGVVFMVAEPAAAPVDEDAEGEAADAVEAAPAAEAEAAE